jgi:hypothetical protein
VGRNEPTLANRALTDRAESPQPPGVGDAMLRHSREGEGRAPLVQWDAEFASRSRDQTCTTGFSSVPIPVMLIFTTSPA